MLDNEVLVYSLCTENRTFFKVNGNLLVCSWNPTEFKDYANKSGLIYSTK
jgi:hypothetical protein